MKSDEKRKLHHRCVLKLGGMKADFGEDIKITILARHVSDDMPVVTTDDDMSVALEAFRKLVEMRAQSKSRK